MNRFAQFLQSLRDLHRRAPLPLAAAAIVLAGATGGFVVSRVAMPAADASPADDMDFASTTPARELSPGSRHLLLDIEVAAGLQSLALRDAHPDFGRALATGAQMTADATSLAPDVPETLRRFLLSNISVVMSALHTGNAGKARSALDDIKSRLSTYRAS